MSRKPSTKDANMKEIVLMGKLVKEAGIRIE